MGPRRRRTNEKPFALTVTVTVAVTGASENKQRKLFRGGARDREREDESCEDGSKGCDGVLFENILKDS